MPEIPEMPEMPNSPTAPLSPSKPVSVVTVATLEKDDAPNAFALQFFKTFPVVLFVRKGREASDEAELRKQIIDNQAASLSVSMNGGPEAKVFSMPIEPDCYFRVLAIVN